jgi:hypothetical protein
VRSDVAAGTGGVRVTAEFTVKPATAVPTSVSIALGRAVPPMEVRSVASVRRRLLKRDTYEVRADFSHEQVNWMGDAGTLDVAVLVTVAGTTKRKEAAR